MQDIIDLHDQVELEDSQTKSPDNVVRSTSTTFQSVEIASGEIKGKNNLIQM